MQPLRTHQGIVVPIDRANVDTDMLLPKEYLKSLEAEGFGEFLFDDERYLDPGRIDLPAASRRRNAAFILNHPPYDRASVLLAQANFGCGSSREHAVWALRDFGIRVLLAPSYGDIFRNNCFNNGLLPVVLPQAEIDRLFATVQADAGIEARVDVEAGTLQIGGRALGFELDEGHRHDLLHGLDEIARTWTCRQAITDYEQHWRQQAPWLFDRRR